MIASSSNFHGDINLWNCDPSTWQSETGEGLKKQRTGVKRVDPIGVINTS